MGSEQTADELFQLLSDEIRLDILRTVAVAQNENKQRGVASLSFSEIYDRVEVDDTSKLSYHLGELTGTFLRKHDENDSYAFTHAGEQLVRFVLAENYRQPDPVGPIETEGGCQWCGEQTLEAILEDQYFMMYCTACERGATAYRVRPAQVRDRTGEDLIDAVAREQVGDLLKSRRGVCPDCAGRIETEIWDTEDVPFPGEPPVPFITASECQSCLRFLSLPLPVAAAYHPESISFHWGHGLDILDAGIWKFNGYLYDDQWTAERVATDPAEYRVEFRREEATLRLFLDETATVTHTERVRRRGQR
ncbi:winged helix-turn-helix domain-containing protein [Halomicroarcula sp. GCM10025709]|uniref:winged helix-turn-helix domain-containing protein n=1 Tax=Haloarcula TaxID=2237 RepID=UPI0024C2EAD7|nr:helix-turn-helix domain-containing protein [Halomicroarcula sp. YJ-61-S]